jgi:hypothetical protein
MEEFLGRRGEAFRFETVFRFGHLLLASIGHSLRQKKDKKISSRAGEPSGISDLMDCIYILSEQQARFSYRCF